MIEHLHWQRTDKSGIAGQHIMIVGYSHYRKKEDPDHAGFTRGAVRKVISGKEKKYGGAMFSAVPSYFGDFAREDFWKKVLFFNFVPDSFLDTEKFATARGNQLEVAKKRFNKILGKEMPDKVFVFSRKAWRDCPLTEEEQTGLCTPLSNGLDNWGTYAINGKKIRACGFRHPMRTDTKKMRSAVQEFLNL